MRRVAAKTPHLRRVPLRNRAVDELLVERELFRQL